MDDLNSSCLASDRYQYEIEAKCVSQSKIAAKGEIKCWLLVRDETRKTWGKNLLGPVSRKSRNFSVAFRVTQFSLYLQNEGVSRHETLQLFLFLFS